MTAAITASKLSKEFGPIRALHDLDLEIPSGSVFGVIGHNGAGTTTLMRILLDIVRPTSGSVTVLGRNPRTAGPALRDRIGFLPGELRLNPTLSGRGHLAFWASLGADPKAAHAEALRLAELLDVRLGDASRKLSKGNKQKLGLIQAFMHRPELVILDEPTSGLDPLVQQQVLHLVGQARDAGATVFLSSHVMSEIEQIADTAAVLNHGRLATVAPMSELRATATRRVRAVARGAAEQVARQVAGLGLQALGHDGEVTVTGLLEGRPNDLVAALAGLDLVSLEVAEPDLEERVLELYGAN